MTVRGIVVGLAQRKPLPLDDWAERFRRDVALTLEARPEIQLLAYPELHLCGADHLPEAERAAALERCALPLDSDAVASLGRLAAEHGIWLCPGSIGELGPNGEFFNTQLLFDPAGELRARYRKMFPWRPFEPHRPGTEFAVLPLGADASGGANAAGAGVVAGLSICYDSWFPEHSRQLAWLGANLVLNVVKTTTPDREQELVLARANAIVNQNVFASVNCAAPLGRGRSIVLDPEGFVIAEAGVGEETLVFAFDPATVAAVRERGTMGSNRMWSQFREGDDPVPLPLYRGRIDPSAWHPQSRDTGQTR